MRKTKWHIMRGNKKRIMSLLTIVFLALASLLGCQPGSGHGPRSTLVDKDASAACLEELSQLIKNSDTEGLVAAFSEKARSDDPELATKAAKLMSLIGGGTISDGHFWSSRGNLRGGYVFVISTAIVTAPDNTKWHIHIIECTYNSDDPSKVGLKSIEIIPNSDREAPKGFGWYNESDEWPYGIRLITSWEGWDPYTSPYTW